MVNGDKWWDWRLDSDAILGFSKMRQSCRALQALDYSDEEVRGKIKEHNGRILGTRILSVGLLYWFMFSAGPLTFLADKYHIPREIYFTTTSLGFGVISAGIFYLGNKIRHMNNALDTGKLQKYYLKHGELPEGRRNFRGGIDTIAI